jgi:two-component system, chemotaxis family, protein-glutamate methylesterase/glutaminase
MVQPPFPVVALVSSAGGLAATSEVLAALPPDFPAAVIALQHMSPDQQSRLPQILGRRSALPVASADDGAELLPGRVLVAPPGFHTLVSHERRVVLIRSGDFPPSRPSADLLLTTMALAIGSDAIAAVMTGAGHDGATGATAIHDRGGVVLATDQATSENFSMPDSTIHRDSFVAAVVPLRELAARLAEVVHDVARKP